MFFATFWDYAWPIGLGLLAGVLIAARKQHDYGGIHVLSDVEFGENMRRGQLLDLRSEDAFHASRINGARSFPRRSIFTQLHKLRTDMPVFLYDDKQTPLARAVARKLVRKGYRTVYVLKGGFAAWTLSVRTE